MFHFSAVVPILFAHSGQAGAAMHTWSDTCEYEHTLSGSGHSSNDLVDTVVKGAHLLSSFMRLACHCGIAWWR